MWKFSEGWRFNLYDNRCLIGEKNCVVLESSFSGTGRPNWKGSADGTVWCRDADRGIFGEKGSDYGSTVSACSRRTFSCLVNIYLVSECYRSSLFWHFIDFGMNKPTVSCTKNVFWVSEVRTLRKSKWNILLCPANCKCVVSLSVVFVQGKLFGSHEGTSRFVGIFVELLAGMVSLFQGLNMCWCNCQYLAFFLVFVAIILCLPLKGRGWRF